MHRHLLGIKPLGPASVSFSTFWTIIYTHLLFGDSFMASGRKIKSLTQGRSNTIIEQIILREGAFF